MSNSLSWTVRSPSKQGMAARAPQIGDTLPKDRPDQWKSEFRPPARVETEADHGHELKDQPLGPNALDLSDRVSYGRMNIGNVIVPQADLRSNIGGPGGSRTPDLLNAIQTRSQLRHGPTPAREM